MSVSATLPGRISSTASYPWSCSASAMRPRMRRSVRKCWPRLFRVGGNAARRSRGVPPSPLMPSALHDDQREVVAARRVAGVVVEQREDARGDLLGRIGTELNDAIEHRLFTEADVLAIARVGDAVGEEPVLD